MGAKAKKARAQKRKLRKKAVKDARRALYRSYAAQGKERARGRRRGKTGPTPGKGNHYVVDCGNPGCKACFPQYARRASFSPSYMEA